uniref:NADH dehydrogenase subunit 6 n=1 Tax=Conidiobolus taihushanensis TaxID=2721185 RepID=UPI001D12AE49|nr:NADH dehydrogenase subunit 6 [Conidiobolus taihushanensis]QZZ81405.1 NADH dehydrogenase subunit 6 [Conidiobolus taihushanensis]
MLMFLSLFTFFSTLLTISSSNPVYSVIGFISLFTFASSYLLFLGLGFIGLTYLIIYVGAIAILFLFVVMMINLKFLTNHFYSNFLPLATLLTFLFFFTNFSFLFLFDSFCFYSSPSWNSFFNSFNLLTSLAFPLYSSFSLWLILASFILLLAMIAPILLISPVFFFYPSFFLSFSLSPFPPFFTFLPFFFLLPSTYSCSFSWFFLFNLSLPHSFY